jgi:hypothetical protein
MPIYVTVYHLDKMIIGKTEGEVTLADIESYLDDVVKARAVPYRKIFDASSGTSVLTPEDVVTLRNKLAEFTQKRDNVGPFAVVTGGNRQGRMANICQTITIANRPMRVFADIHSARQWLEEKLPIS